MTGWGDFILQMLTLVVACASVAVTVGLFISKRAAQGRERIIELLTTQHATAMEAIATTKREGDEKDERMRHETGEAVSSMRQQITDIGFFLRDNYIHKEVFRESVTSIKDAISTGLTKLETQITKIEGTVDIKFTKIDADIRSVEAEIRNGHSAAEKRHRDQAR